MNDLPIRSLMVSDFRRIQGTRVLPFDAPVVLIHGPNGSGKTSILSALELALTGGVRSMERQDERYVAHLPFLGQPYATVRAEVAGYLQAGTRSAPLTVGGNRIEGPRALSAKAAQFYSERCYLDQASLGRLLELYQARVGTEESALAKFVSELLGLEKLDALRDGLSVANDLRLLKKLAVGVDEAATKAKLAAANLKKESELLTQTRVDLLQARTAVREALEVLNAGVVAHTSDLELLRLARSSANEGPTREAHTQAEKLHKDLIALGGRIAALSGRPSAPLIGRKRTAIEGAQAERKNWDTSAAPTVNAWEAAALAAGLHTARDPRSAVEEARTAIQYDLANLAEARANAESLGAQLDADRIELEQLETRLANAHEHSSALVEGLVALRTVVSDNNVCPVCDRDYNEKSADTLFVHVETKLAELSIHGQELIKLRAERDHLAARKTRAESRYSQLAEQLLTPDAVQKLEKRQVTIDELADQVEDIEVALSRRDELIRVERELQLELENLEAAFSQDRHISAELVRCALFLKADVLPGMESFHAPWLHLLGLAESQVERNRDTVNQYRTTAAESERLAKALQREAVSIQRIAELAEDKNLWEARVAEARRRQSVAKDVHEAASRARTAIVQRVFTESLNEVWSDVFTRLAPTEGFIPRFGIPTATKTALDIKLETTHRTGTAGGPPQMMLSAGNLNTAALSLFLALHLAVQPVMPCLVFDDPVQAMDEVHVSQFAGLIRVLAKQHGRQVVIAVHERELFDYLALELSPAYEGDELITIELGERTDDEDEGITRHIWRPDIAIAS